MSGLVKHKVFVSYHHKNDELYRGAFDSRFSRIFVNKSVKSGDINSDNSTEYIARLIREQYLSDASVCVVLIGAETYKRKHVDWEIAAALTRQSGGRSGLVGLLLPSHPDFSRSSYTSMIVPPRLHANILSGYASLYKWTENLTEMYRIVDEAFRNRIRLSDKAMNSMPKYTYNKP